MTTADVDSDDSIVDVMKVVPQFTNLAPGPPPRPIHALYRTALFHADAVDEYYN